MSSMFNIKEGQNFGNFKIYEKRFTAACGYDITLIGVVHYCFNTVIKHLCSTFADSFSQDSMLTSPAICYNLTLEMNKFLRCCCFFLRA